MTVGGYWMVLAIVGAGTVLMRSLPIVLHGRKGMPRSLAILLQHVPAAALTALIVPAVLYSSGEGAYPFDVPRILAGLIALGAALRTRSAVMTIAFGMVSLWTFTALLG